jgi:hypothetical protein
MKRENEMTVLSNGRTQDAINHTTIFNRRTIRELGIIADVKYLQTCIDSFRDGALTLDELRQRFADFLDSTSGE